MEIPKNQPYGRHHDWQEKPHQLHRRLAVWRHRPARIGGWDVLWLRLSLSRTLSLQIKTNYHGIILSMPNCK